MTTTVVPIGRTGPSVLAGLGRRVVMTSGAGPLRRVDVESIEHFTGYET